MLYPSAMSKLPATARRLGAVRACGEIPGNPSIPCPDRNSRLQASWELWACALRGRFRAAVLSFGRGGLRAWRGIKRGATPCAAVRSPYAASRRHAHRQFRSNFGLGLLSAEACDCAARPISFGFVSKTKTLILFLALTVFVNVPRRQDHYACIRRLM